MADEIIKSNLLFQGNTILSKNLTVRDTSTGNLLIVVPEQYQNHAVDLKELFIDVVGRPPLVTDKVVFLVPNGRSLIGAARITAAVNTGNNEQGLPVFENITVSPMRHAISYLGFPEGIDVTLAIEGEVIGCPQYQTTSQLINYIKTIHPSAILVSVSTWDYDSSIWGNSSDEPPPHIGRALAVDQNLKVWIRNTGLLVGGGAFSSLGAFEWTGNGNEVAPLDPGSGGNVIYSYTNGIEIKLRNEGNFRGGAPGGGRAGDVWARILDGGYNWDFVEVRGGGGAPYGGRSVISYEPNGKLITIETINNSRDGMNNIVVLGGSATKLYGGLGTPRRTTSLGGYFFDLEGGKGSDLYSNNATTGQCRRYQGVGSNNEWTTNMKIYNSAVGSYGKLVEDNITLIYDNTITY